MDKKFYAVRQGFSVKIPGCADVFIAGGVIELDDATAALHVHKIEPLSAEQQAAFDAERADAADAATMRDIEADEANKRALEAEAKALKDVARAAAEVAKNA